MSKTGGDPLVLVAAGGTGGHLFPAEALAAALAKRDIPVALATDSRAAKLAAFPPERVHVIPSATWRGRDPISIARTGSTLAYGLARAFLLYGKLKPSVVVGFGGYPTVPPVMAASLRGIPTLIHEQNGVMGRANRFLAGRVSAIATGFAGVTDHDPKLKAKTTCTGNPVRPAVVTAAATPFETPETDGAFRLLVFGGSQGARVMADIVPDAIARLEPHLLHASPDRAAGAGRGSAARARRLCARRESRPMSRRSFRICRRGWRQAISWSRAPARRPWPNWRRSAGRRSWCRCRMRSTRTRTPMPGAGKGRRRDPAAAGGIHARIGWRPKSQALPAIRRGLPAWPQGAKSRGRA